MEKKYIMPATTVIELSEVQSLLAESLSENEEDLNSLDFDPTKSGGEQLTKGQGVWDNEW